MNTRSLDRDRFKSDQCQQWDNVAVGWMKWWETWERAAQQVSDRLLDLAEVRSGHRVLDIATGIGEPAVTAALRVGPSGHVVATDVAPQMIAISQDRAEMLKLKNLEFLVMDAEELDFPEKSFDSILCRWGLMFLPDLEETLKGIRRMLVPGGKFATTVLDAAPKVPFLSIAIEAAQKIFQMPAPPPGTPTLFGLADGVLEKVFISAGFKDVHSEIFSFNLEYASAKSYMQFLQEVPAALVALLSSQQAERIDEFMQALLPALEQFILPDGCLCIPNSTINVVGRR